MIKYIVFDFDGTLVDSKEAFVSAFNHLAQKYKFKRIEEGSLPYLKPLSMMERLRFLKVPLYRIPFLTNEFLSLYKKELGSVTLIDGMEAVLERIANLGFGIGIVSSNSVSTIKGFLANKGIAGVPDIYCSGRLFGKDRVLRRFLKDKNVTGDEVLYVCDELRDILACNKVPIKPIWVSWGFEMEEAVKGGAVFHTANTTQELIAIIESCHYEYLSSDVGSSATQPHN